MFYKNSEYNYLIPYPLTFSGQYLRQLMPNEKIKAKQKKKGKEELGNSDKQGHLLTKKYKNVSKTWKIQLKKKTDAFT